MDALTPVRLALRTRLTARGGLTAHKHLPVIRTDLPALSCCTFRPFCLQPPAAVPMRCLTFSDHRAYRRLPMQPRPFGTERHLGFAIGMQARHSSRPNRVCGGWPKPACTTDWSFASGCSPPRLAATQLPSATGCQTLPGEDLHLADATDLQAHMPRPCAGETHVGFYHPTGILEPNVGNCEAKRPGLFIDNIVNLPGSGP